MALTYHEIEAYSGKVKSVVSRAVKELSDGISRISAGDPRTRAYAVRRQVAYYAEKYGLPMQELGAQWYELCARKAGAPVERAMVDGIDYGDMDERFEALLDGYASGGEDWESVEPRIRSAFEDELRGAERSAIIGNLDRDERGSRRRYRQTGRAAARAGYARVPVGETCAWCYMLASLGYYYRSERTALGVDPDHYHAHCDCIAVPYHGPDAIEGYDDYEMYYDMYATARDSYRRGDIPDGLQRRIDDAKARHDAAYESGAVRNSWNDYNAILMVMREQQGLKH